MGLITGPARPALVHGDTWNRAEPLQLSPGSCSEGPVQGSSSCHQTHFTLDGPEAVPERRLIRDAPASPQCFLQGVGGVAFYSASLTHMHFLDSHVASATDRQSSVQPPVTQLHCRHLPTLCAPLATFCLFTTMGKEFQRHQRARGLCNSEERTLTGDYPPWHRSVQTLTVQPVVDPPLPHQQKLEADHCTLNYPLFRHTWNNKAIIKPSDLDRVPSTNMVEVGDLDLHGHQGER
ncbi:unnamed protein product [Pleuronectes platessa]|uniref:Uncharacterized protein n=1 Tax=Pleuronectes platessa TaxID=8262 RepID=A0A9N7V336_PLEPL|nr:unnamed protein product [Pleuronectes platessa]